MRSTGRYESRFKDLSVFIVIHGDDWIEALIVRALALTMLITARKSTSFKRRVGRRVQWMVNIATNFPM